jgi:hypothetical protein
LTPWGSLGLREAIPKPGANDVRDLEAIWGTHTGALHAWLPSLSIVLSIALTVLLNLLIRFVLGVIAPEAAGLWE